MFDDMRRRCAIDQPILADAVRTLARDAPISHRTSLERLADGLFCRTTLRPEAVSVPAVAAALNQLLSHMVDRKVFMGRHTEALNHLGVECNI